mgnify:CR=1 FL=1|jgi:hypothetical protein
MQAYLMRLHAQSEQRNFHAWLPRPSPRLALPLRSPRAVHAGSTHNNHGNALRKRVQSSVYPAELQRANHRAPDLTAPFIALPALCLRVAGFAAHA